MNLIYEIIEDARENPKKCTVSPLKYRDDFHFFIARKDNRIAPLQATWLLHHEGECMSALDRAETVSGIAVIDCIWRRLDRIFPRIDTQLPRLVKIPPEFVTAYPRKSKDGSDPSGGLATIEAIFIAAAFAGNWDESLLKEYYFGLEFLRLNEPLWQQYELKPEGS